MSTEKSTTVRSLPAALRATRLALTGLARVAPVPAATVASWLFCRPTRHRRPAGERELLLAADPFDVRLGRRTLRAWRWGDGERVVFLVHGWSGRGSQLGALVDPLVERGFSVVAWDGPGHGASAGSSSSLVEMADSCFAVARALRITPHGIVGHSMGAAAGAVAVAEGLAVERAVWISPPASLLHFVDEYARFLGFSPRARDGIVRSMEARFSVTMRDYDVEEVDVPHGDRMLVLHDVGDREVPVEHGRRVAEAIGAASFETTDGLGHRRILRDRDLVDRTADWIAGLGPGDTARPGAAELGADTQKDVAITNRAKHAARVHQGG